MNTDEIINKLFSCSNQEIVSTIMGINRESFIFQLQNYPKSLVTIKDWGGTNFYIKITLIEEDTVDESHIALGSIYKEFFEEKLKRVHPHISVDVLCPIHNKIINEKFIREYGHSQGPLSFCFFDSDFEVSF